MKSWSVYKRVYMDSDFLLMTEKYVNEADVHSAFPRNK